MFFVQGTPSHPLRRSALTISLVAGALALAACGGGDKKGSTQVAAKVNKEEISVHQINFVLQRQPGLKPEQAPAASKRILEGLIDQELAIQAATDLKLDREPGVVTAIEAAKRDIIARAYADKISGSVSAATADEIANYYKAKPALFAQRRIYTLQEVSIEGGAEAAKAVAPAVQAAKSADDLTRQLTAASVKFNVRNTTQPAENLPLNLVDNLGALNEGQSLSVPTPTGVNVVFITSAKPQPVTLEQAKPAIEQFLGNDRKRKLLADETKRLREKAAISYEGQFADAAASASK